MYILNKLQHWLLKRIHQEDSATLTARRIYILPTREGVIFALIIIVMLAAAINFNNAMVFFFTFLMAGIGIISMHMTQSNLVGLRFSIAHVTPVYCFQNLNLPLIIEHSKDDTLIKNRQNFSINIQLIEKKKQSSHLTELDINELADVFYNEKTQLHLFYPTRQRGRINLAPMTVSSRYPLGLFRAWANIELSNDAIIYPKPAKKSAFEPQSGSDSEGQGEKGRGFDDFSGFKTYQPGESLKHIHWKAYAREQGLLSKTFSGSNRQEYWLNWDDLSGNIESRLSLLCRLIIEAEKHGDRYGLNLPGVSIAINQGTSHQHECLKSLALYRI